MEVSDIQTQLQIAIKKEDLNLSLTYNENWCAIIWRVRRVFTESLECHGY